MKHFLRFAPFRQGIINMYVVGLYHLIEQQCFLFYRKANKPALNTNLKFEHLEYWLNKLGIAVKEFNSWPKFERLMLASNCVKHSEGSSCRSLREKEPGWFVELPDMQQAELRSTEPRSVEQPIFGQGIYLDKLTLWDLTDVTIAFWDELGSALARST
jgi:hypothetical protein